MGRCKNGCSPLAVACGRASSISFNFNTKGLELDATVQERLILEFFHHNMGIEACLI